MICAIQASTSVEKIMDWQLKGGLYIDINKFYGYADIHDYVVGNFRIGCLLAPDTHLYNVSSDVTLTIGGIWLVIICITGYINKKRS